MAHLSSQNLMQKPTSHERNFRRLRLQKQSLRTPPRECRVHHAARATRHWELAATQWTEFESKNESSTSPGESSARLPTGLRPHRHLWCQSQSTWSAQKGTVGIKGWQSVAAPLATDLRNQVLPFATVYFTSLAFQCCQMLSKKQPRLCHLSPNRTKTSPLCGVGPIII